MDESKYLEVNFHKYCARCKYRRLEEVQSPCNECLEVGMREGTRQPECFKEKDK